MWWSGPSWLTKPSHQWPSNISSLPNTTQEERRSKQVHTTVIAEPWDLSSRYSSWTKLLRCTAYILRFVERIRHPPKFVTSIKPSPITIPLLSPAEITAAEIFWYRSIQTDLFPSEIASLKKATSLPKASPLFSLSPYTDDQRLLRVRGRLRHANIDENVRHPIIFKDHPLVRVIIRDTHIRALHAGSQLTLSLLREKYWFLRARSLVRAVFYQCVKCTRERAAIPSELMGDLPRVRVSSSIRAFVHTGVDYAGPVLVRTAKGRGQKAHKSYIAVFKCMTIKAIHLKLVSDYSTDAFIAAFHRFTSRRGLPTLLYSGNGTTFQGADREMRTAEKIASKNTNFLNKLAADTVKFFTAVCSAFWRIVGGSGKKRQIPSETFLRILHAHI